MQQRPAIKNNVLEKMTSKRLFVSDFYEIKDLSYDLISEKQNITGFNDALCMVYVKTGGFLLDYFVKSYNMHSGYILLDKPNYDYIIRPSAGACTIFNFTNDFYQQWVSVMHLNHAFFFSNQNILSVMLPSNPAIDYLHYQIVSKLNIVSKLEIDTLVLEFFRQVAGIITNDIIEEEPVTLPVANRLTAIELAKDYMHKNFSKDISLQEIAMNSFISPFHFSRLFKKTTSFSPHHYLQNIRLKHGEMLLKNGNLPVTDIAYAAGFSSTAYFATAFKQKYRMSPVQYRRMN